MSDYGNDRPNLELVIHRDNLVKTMRQIPCVLLLDTSGSMLGDKIDKLNQGLHTFKEHVQDSIELLGSLELSVITFGGHVADHVKVVSNFEPAKNFNPPRLEAVGVDTPIAKGILHAAEVLRQCSEDYNQNGISTHKPWLIIMTDGFGTDDSNVDIEARRVLNTLEANGLLTTFCIGIGDDKPQHLQMTLDRLKGLGSRQPAALDGLKFNEFFKWASEVLIKVSQSSPDDEIQAPPPNDWMNFKI